MIVRVLVAVLMLLAFCVPAHAGSDHGGRFEKLLSMLNPDSDMVMIVDLSKLAQDYQALRDWILRTPVVKSSPATRAEAEKQLKQLDDELAKIKEKYSVDVTHDLQLFALGVNFVEQGTPGLVMLVQGKFPEQLPAKIAEGASPQTIEGHEVYLDNSGEPLMMTLVDDMMIFAEPESLPGILKNKDGTKTILTVHPDLKAGLSGGQTMKIDIAFARFGKKLADEDNMRVMSTILRSLSRIRFKAGQGFTLSMDFSDAKGAQRGEFLLKGLREQMLGGSHMYRAYGKLLMGFDLEKVPGFPPEAMDALRNRTALTKTLDEVFPTVKDRPGVVRRANTVQMSGSRQMALGGSFILGIGASVAIPAFIGFMRRSNPSLTQMALADVRAALDMFRLDNMRYPTAEEGLEVLVNKGLLKDIPKDSYGNPLQYAPKGNGAYTLRSLGADGKTGGKANNKDVVVESD